MEKRQTEKGCPVPDSKFTIDITAKGPYLVYGNPELQQEILSPGEDNIPYKYVKGHKYPTTGSPTALCRCGYSKNHPYCDGSHQTAEWDATLTANNTPLLDEAELYDGPAVELADNIKYCVHARFCMARGTIWELTQSSDNPEAKDTAAQQAMLCPSGRLKLWDKKGETFYEPPLQPKLGLIEDPQKKCSGPIWVKGGIAINGPDGVQYERRNRITLCRCGLSKNKPFCDGTHIKQGFHDNLPLK